MSSKKSLKPETLNMIDKVAETKPVEPVKSVTLTAEQQRIASLVSSAKDDFSGIKITDYVRRIEMEIPKVVKKPEFAYCWIFEGNLDKELINAGGIFEIVTRSNHSHVPDSLFGITGAILYKGENILCFTKREIAEGIDRHRIAKFNQKMERTENLSQEYAGGKISVGKVEDTDGGYNEQEMNPDAQYGPSPK